MTAVNDREWALLLQEQDEPAADARRRAGHGSVGMLARPLRALLTALGCVARYGRNVPLAEDWLLVPVEHFEPAPTSLSDYEERTLSRARWWRTDELVATAETVFPPDLGVRLRALLADGLPATPTDISDPTAP